MPADALPWEGRFRLSCDISALMIPSWPMFTSLNIRRSTVGFTSGQYVYSKACIVAMWTRTLNLTEGTQLCGIWRREPCTYALTLGARLSSIDLALSIHPLSSQVGFSSGLPSSQLGRVTCMPSKPLGAWFLASCRLKLGCNRLAVTIAWDSHSHCPRPEFASRCSVHPTRRLPIRRGGRLFLRVLRRPCLTSSIHEMTSKQATLLLSVHVGE